MNLRAVFIASVVALIAAFIAANAASASASSWPANVTPKKCGTGHDDGRVTVYAGKTTSCKLAWATYRKFSRRAHRCDCYPMLVRAKSPVTGRTYAFVRQVYRLSPSRAWVYYAGDGDNHRGVDARFVWTY